MSQNDLFIFGDVPLQSVELIELEDGEILWARRFYDEDTARQLYSRLQEEIPWRQDNIRIAGKEMPIPRLQAWFGDPGMNYTYSGMTLEPTPWSDTLLTIKEQIEDYGDHRFNSLLANLYRDEQDSVGWHADNEPELGANPVIASLSLGAERTFQLKHRKHPERKLALELASGDLLIMKGSLQHFWLHQIPKNRHPTEPRINLTFRRIIEAGTGKL
ncbi:alpha-ketoglutarate-dependent dioxygenase AlkB family protein [Ketobacter sp.]|uniref:alpha-ketoglutarate-dependent dioxygenase AlkB family protein n=1 Tax=Ketobacter sp. TaxID=2083498 RepID=UPI000F18D086|nr:alpha-ketoglutarate-dependent dioxygenase AlkB [Ketobacter sp.]RLU00241.1 MAG: alpha-ketoglutarate-dependent dioxygenase AlkB [Ketobacter sp.]